MAGARLEQEPPRPSSAALVLRGLGRPERLMGLAAVLLAAAILAIVVALVGLAGLRATAVRSQNEARAARLAVYGLMQASIDAETGQRGYLLTNDPLFLEPYESGRSEALRHLARLRETAANHSELQDNVERAEALAQRAFQQLAAPIERRPSPPALRETLRTSKAAMDGLRGEAGSLLRAVEALMEATRAAEVSATEKLYWLGGALALSAMIAIAVTLLALIRERKTWRETFGALAAARDAAEDARARAAASDLAKTRFLAVASHDMRQPLHALTLYLSALDRRIDHPEARAILAKMERATDSMIAMFSTLLDLARVQAGAVEPEMTDFALQDVFDRLAAENPDGQVEVQRTELRLHSDAVLIERALRNLVSNALKHGGGRARLGASANGDRAEIVVADEGPGIAAEDQERMFEEFVRLDARSEGLGLGLAIVRGVARALDVPLEVQSEPGGGARFILRPLLAGRAAPSSAPATQTHGLAGARALVVDDEQLAREAVARALSDIGAHVRMAGNEADALRAIEEGFAPQLLVMDLRIDDELQGLEIAQRLRERVPTPPHVIVITGDTAPDTLTLLQRSGFAWLIKPVNPRELSQLAAAQLAAG
ncbi:MAG TPA: CHASE3 domain-containing protein [Vitreimonas sp.]|jgi:signal transduction histidine kinase|nr:CHASE3 domain-containing protein [Vitreimonas sp.]